MRINGVNVGKDILDDAVIGRRLLDFQREELGLTGGREAPEGDRELTRTTVAVGHKAPDNTESPKPISSTEKEKVQAAGQDGGDGESGDGSKTRRAR